MEILFIILVIIEILLLVLAYMVFLSGRKIRQEITNIIKNHEPGKIKKYKKENIDKLPEPVQRYFNNVLSYGQEYISIAKIRQSGYIRMKKGQKWVPLKALQCFSFQEPSFVWAANAKISPFAWIVARDKYYRKKGNMLVKLFSIFTMVNAAGKEIDVSSFIRYFAEAPWFPTTLLPSKNLSWRKVDSNSAKAIITDGKNNAELLFTFSDDGKIIRVSTFDRYMEEGGKKVKKKWTGYFKNYKKIGAIKIPAEIEAEWNLEEGDFRYIKLKIDAVKYSYSGEMNKNND